MTYYILYKAKRKNAKRHIWAKFNDYEKAIYEYCKITRYECTYNFELTNGKFKTIMKNGVLIQ